MLAAVFGAGGQTGYYLCRELLTSGYSVIGVVRNNTPKLFPTYKGYSQLELDLSERIDFQRAFLGQEPSIFVNLAGLSSVLECESKLELSYRLNFELVRDLLSFVETLNSKNGNQTYFFQASSSEMYSGNSTLKVVDEFTPLSPYSTYGKHKSLAHQLVQQVRNDTESKASNLILFNHESPRRPAHFVSRKITKSAYEISLGVLGQLELGNTGAKRDWGHAEDYAKVLKRLIDSRHSGDFVLGSGLLHSINEFVQIAFNYFNLQPASKYIITSKILTRSNEHPGLTGDTSTIRGLIGELNLRSFEDMIIDMCRHEKLNSIVD